VGNLKYILFVSFIAGKETDWFAHNARTAAHVARFQLMTLVGGIAPSALRRGSAHRLFSGCLARRNARSPSRSGPAWAKTRRFSRSAFFVPRATAFARTTCATFAWASLAVDRDQRLKERNIRSCSTADLASLMEPAMPCNAQAS